MPVSITKLSSNRFRVKTPNMIHARSTTLAKAYAQRRLIMAVEKGWKPTGRK